MKTIDELRADEVGLPYGGLATPDEPLVCFPMRADLPAAIAETVSFPAPLVTSRGPRPEPPKPVRDLEAFAVKIGWTVESTYSEGWTPHASRGTPVGPKKLWAVRMVKGDRRAVGVRTDDTWTSFWAWSPRRLMRRSTGLIVFKVDIAEDF